MACLFGHKWNGCKCTKCSATRNEQHAWNGRVCSVCGAERDANHQGITIEEIQKLTDQSFLTELAKSKENYGIAQAAFTKLTDASVFADVAKNGFFTDVCKAALNKLTDQSVFAEIVRTGNNEEVCEAAVNKLTDQHILLDIVCDTKLDFSIRITAVMKLTDQSILATIIKNNEEYYILQTAIEQITAQNVLFDIVKDTNNKYKQSYQVSDDYDASQHRTEDLRVKALEMINDQSFLIDIAKNNTDGGLRKAAIMKISDQTVLIDIATDKNSTSLFRVIAAKKLENSQLARQVYCDIAKTENDYFISNLLPSSGINLMSLLTDRELLSDVVKNAKDSSVRENAKKRIKELL